MNFTTASKKLFISQPTLSSHIAALEKELGCDLITHGRTIALTQAGRTLVEEAPQLISLHDDVADKCRNAAINGGRFTFSSSFLRATAFPADFGAYSLASFSA